MSKRDRTTLGGLVLAMIVGVGGSLGLAASCLGRDRAHREDDPRSLQPSEQAFPEDRSARTSSGGVPGEEAVGQTQVTSVELPAGAAAPANTAPPAPENAPPPNPNPTAAPMAMPTANVHGAGDQVRTTTGSPGSAGSAGDGGAANIGAPTEGVRDGGATNGTGTTTGGDASTTSATTRAASPAAPVAPPPLFISEPPPYGASNWIPNHEAGAGPFTTERNVPDRPGP